MDAHHGKMTVTKVKTRDEREALKRLIKALR